MKTCELSDPGDYDGQIVPVSPLWDPLMDGLCAQATAFLSRDYLCQGRFSQSGKVPDDVKTFDRCACFCVSHIGL